MVIIDSTFISLYKKFFSSNKLIDIVIGVFEISHIIKYGVDSNGVGYNLILDCESQLLLEFLCYAWTSKIKATAFKKAMEEWIVNQEVPYHIIPKKDYFEYVRENVVLQCPKGFDI